MEKGEFMKSIFASLVAIAFSISAHAADTKEVTLFFVKSDRSGESKALVNLILNEDGKVTAFKYITPKNPAGKILGTPADLDRGFYIPGLPREDLVHISSRAGQFDPANGGKVTLRYITNAITNSTAQAFYEADLDGGEWKFYSNNRTRFQIRGINIQTTNFPPGISGIQDLR
jgi:hypothetical protein